MASINIETMFKVLCDRCGKPLLTDTEYRHEGEVVLIVVPCTECMSKEYRRGLMAGKELARF